MPESTPARLDPWDVLGLPGAVTAAGFLTSPNAAQYRLIVTELAAEQAQSLTGVSHDELAARLLAKLPPESAADLVASMNLEARLAQLVDWGTCEAWQDRAETEADFLRNRSRYQLTETGAALHRLAVELDTDLAEGSTAALVAPSTLSDRLAGMLAAVASRDFVAAQGEYAQVQTTLAAMSTTAAAWQSKLAAALGGAPDEAKVTRMLETILAYVEAWGSGVDAHSATIGGLVAGVRALPDQTWRAMALARLGSDAADHVTRAVTEELRGVAPVLEHWFCGHSPQAARLRRQMRDAIAPVLRTHRTLLAVGGTVSRKAELVRLAHAIEGAPDEPTAWRLWATATSLFSARHLSLLAPEVDRPTQTSVWDAPPAPVSSRLRAQGHRSLVGRAARMADTTEARKHARAVAARERADLARAEAALAQRSGTRLAQWPELDAPQAELFLHLVSDARNSRRADGTMTGTSSDGRWRMTLRPRPGSAVIRTPHGRLVLEDALVEFGS